MIIYLDIQLEVVLWLKDFKLGFLILILVVFILLQWFYFWLFVLKLIGFQDFNRFN